MKFEDLAISDSQIVKFIWELDYLILIIKNWQESLFQIKFNGVEFVKAENFYNTDLDSIQIIHTNCTHDSSFIIKEVDEDFVTYKFFEAWKNDCILEVIASPNYSIVAF